MRKPAIFELRNYTMQPGRRDEMIALFEQEFVESQEALGSSVVGTFRNLDDPDRFVWIRGFADMERRYEALNSFYTSALWLAHRAAANATIADSDDVFLLRLADGALPVDPAPRPPVGAARNPDTLIVAATYFIAPDDERDFAVLLSRAAPSGGKVIARLLTEHSANSYPRLPIRESETVCVTLTRFANAADYRGEPALPEALQRMLVAPMHVMRLQPTARSLLR